MTFEEEMIAELQAINVKLAILIGEDNLTDNVKNKYKELIKKEEVQP